MTPDIEPPDRTQIVGFIAAVAAFGALFVALYIGYRYAGLIDTMVYVTVFLLAATAIPGAIMLFGDTVPGSQALAKMHVALGAFAFNHHYLVQTDDGWDWCPGDKDRVWIDGDWHDIEGGEEHRSVLGWRPFGILRYKESDTLQDIRADAKADVTSGRRSSDGGVVERGGYKRRKKPTVQQYGDNIDWLVNLERVYTRGVQKIGDIELIETAEEIIERGQVEDSFMDKNRPALTFLAALAMGVLTGIGYSYLLA